MHHILEVRTRGKGLYPFTREVATWVASTKAETGLLTVFIQHTSASLVIQEMPIPTWCWTGGLFRALVPEDDPRYRHDTEGPDDMPAHIRTALTGTSRRFP